MISMKRRRALAAEAILFCLLGPCAEHIVDLVAHAWALTPDQCLALAHAQRACAYDVQHDRVVGGYLVAGAMAQTLTRAGLNEHDEHWATVAAREAGAALCQRHHLTPAEYATRTRAWRTVIGPLHPDDPPLLETS